MPYTKYEAQSPYHKDRIAAMEAILRAKILNHHSSSSEYGLLYAQRLFINKEAKKYLHAGWTPFESVEKAWNDHQSS